MRFSDVDRVAVIDHREASDTYGRVIDAWEVDVEAFIQDTGRTLKVFIKDKENGDVE